MDTIRYWQTSITEKISPVLKDPALLALRILCAYRFLVLSQAKLGDILGTVHYFNSIGIPFPELTTYVIGFAELIGALLIGFGVYTELSAFVLSLFCAFGYLQIYTSAWGSLDNFMGVPTFFPLVACLLLIAFGPGNMSVDGIGLSGVEKKEVQTHSRAKVAAK